MIFSFLTLLDNFFILGFVLRLEDTQQCGEASSPDVVIDTVIVEADVVRDAESLYLSQRIV
jgi:hypothetical protein